MKHFQAYKNRTVEKFQKVKVYKNLHNELWSIKDFKSGLVLGHTENVTLVNVEFKVSEAGRQRVLHERKKNVHAFVVGEIVACELKQEGNNYSRVVYNPYKYDSFRYVSERDHTTIKASNASLITMQASTSTLKAF